MEGCIPLTACRLCLRAAPTPFMSLGMMPNINKFLKSEEEIQREKKYPLEAAFCANCSHVQLTCALSPEETFSEYLYFSSMSDAFVAHGRELAERAHTLARLTQGDLVVEIASNDGAVLQSFVPYTKNILGVEPARNIAQVANERGIRTLEEFFSSACARRLRDEYGAAKVIVGTNVLAHILDLRDFVEGIHTLLHLDGVALIEVPYVRELLANLEFDTIYHEHLSYFSVTALNRLFSNAGLRIMDVCLVPIHGGSLLLSICHNESTQASMGTMREYLAKERAAGLDTIEPYRRFAEDVATVRTSIITFINDLLRGGATCAGYGAAAKGNVLVNFCGLTNEQIPWIADRSPHKQGMRTPGTHIPVVAPEKILETQPDYLVIFPWNFKDEIMAQQAEYAHRGGKFVILLPEPRVW